MGIVGCINAISLQQYAALPLSDGRSAIERVIETVETLCDRIVVLRNSEAEDNVSFPPHCEHIAAPRWSRRSILEALAQIGQPRAESAPAANEDAEDVILYTYADAPFLDIAIARQLIGVHRTYLAEYTFADGYPEGVSPEILSCTLPARLLHLCGEEDAAPTRTMLFTAMQLDINAFDIETELSPVDLRHLRLSLTCGTRRNFLLCKRLSTFGISDASRLIEVLRTNGEIMRTLPAYFSIEIITSHPQKPIHSTAQLLRSGSPDSAARTEMPISDLAAILDKIEDFASDGMVHLSSWGEIGLHSEVLEILRLFSARPHLQLLVETSGVGWEEESLRAIKSGEFDWVTWIVALDADDEELYMKLRGEGYQTARQFAEMLMETYPDQTHIQMVRMKENEAHLEQFYHKWKERTKNIIIQKYDDACGRLPSRRVVDTSPLTRHPCWHLQRDMVVRIDGTVPACREDLELENVWGNMLKDDIEQIWDRGARWYQAHLRQEYPALCVKCDEYYTYNN